MLLNISYPSGYFIYICSYKYHILTKRILFIVPYPIGEAPSQRFRFEQYFDILNERKIKYAIKPFLTQKAWKIFYSGNKLWIFYYLMLGLFRRIVHITQVPFVDYVFIHREATPIGPPIFEWLIAKVFCKRIIYDFDDAIWLSDPDEKNSLIAKLKWKSKVALVCKWSNKVCVGNNYLAHFARNYNQNVVVNPTTIDTENLHNPQIHKGTNTQIDLEKTVIGWTGTHSTLQYLTPIIPVLKELEKRHQFTFMVIANKKPDYDLKSLVFIPWKKKTELADLMRIDIGIMPLSNNDWSNGKCGFKLLQYMALEKPSIASPVGINTQLIKEGYNGYICQTNDDWLSSLESLLTDQNKRIEMGKKGRNKVIQNYSVLSNRDNFLSFFE